MISLCTFVKNEENCIHNMIKSVECHIDELVLVDTGSTDNTIKIAKDTAANRKHAPLPIRIYNIGFTNFAEIRTIASHLAQHEWVLMLDADETLSNPRMLYQVMSQDSKAFAFPRKRWLDLDMMHQTELEAFPDWQVRFYRNDKSFTWKRQLHEYFDGTAVHNFSTGPIINHFHDVWKTPERLRERAQLYTVLAKEAGVTIEGGREL